MELDQLRDAWQSLGRILERQHDLALTQWRERRLERARARLNPLVFGQALQIAFGALTLALGIATWSHAGTSVAQFATGIALHVYGVALVASAIVVLSLVGRIDYTAPVVAIQIALARLRRTYIATGLALGLPWWFLWVPYAIAIVRVATGVDLCRHMAGPLAWMLGVGIAGLAVTLAAIRAALRSQRPRLAQVLRDSAAGRSLRRAQADLDEVARFAAE